MKRNRKRITLALVFCILASLTAGCGVSPSAPAPSRENQPENTSKSPSAGTDEKSSSSPSVSRVEDVSELTLEQKVGQMFFLCFRKETTGADILTCTPSVSETLRTIQPGGIILFGENISSVEQVRGLIRGMQNECSIPPFLGVD